MGNITDKKQLPVKKGLAVGPRLIGYFELANKYFASQNEYLQHNDEAIKRIHEGKEKYGQWMYTEDGLNTYEQTSSELDDALYYMTKEIMRGPENTYLTEDELASLQTRLITLAAFLEILIRGNFLDNEPQRFLKQAMLTPHEDDVL